MSTPVISPIPKAAPAVKQMFVRAYVDPNRENMGLENYDLPMFEGVPQFEPLGYIEKNGVKKFLTGLDETSPEVLKLPEEQRKAVVADIRETVATVVEMIQGTGKPDPSLKNKDFWKECAILAPTNSDFWGKDVTYPNGFTLELYVAGMMLTMDNYMDILIARAIKAGGYKCLVASSLQEAKENSRSIPFKFFLDYLEDTSATKTELRKITNKAKAILDDLRDSNCERLRVIATCFDPNGSEYKTTTPADIIYLNMDRGIDGELWEKDKRQAATTFLSLSKMSDEELGIKSLVKLSAIFKFIDTKKDGYIYFMETGNVLGRSIDEAEQFLRNPIHDDILISLKRKVEIEMNR